jgi:hypothetical protein
MMGAVASVQSYHCRPLLSPVSVRVTLSGFRHGSKQLGLYSIFIFSLVAFVGQEQDLLSYRLKEESRHV